MTRYSFVHSLFCPPSAAPMALMTSKLAEAETMIEDGPVNNRIFNVFMYVCTHTHGSDQKQNLVTVYIWTTAMQIKPISIAIVVS